MDEQFSMAESAVAMHELFTSLIVAGFTQSQALWLVASQTKEIGPPPGGAE